MCNGCLQAYLDMGGNTCGSDRYHDIINLLYLLSNYSYPFHIRHEFDPKILCPYRVDPIRLPVIIVQIRIRLSDRIRNCNMEEY